MQNTNPTSAAANALVGSFANYTEIDRFADVRGRVVLLYFWESG